MLAECDSKFVNINVQYPVFNAFVIESIMYFVRLSVHIMKEQKSFFVFFFKKA